MEFDISGCCAAGNEEGASQKTQIVRLMFYY